MACTLAHTQGRDCVSACYVRLLLEVLEDRVVPSVTIGNPTAGTDLLGFENGLAGWNVNKGDTGQVSVVTQWVANGGTDPVTGTSAAPRTYGPEGDNQHFAVLKTAGPDSVTTLSQTFTVAKAGERLSFSAFFDGGDHAPFNDYGDVVLYDGGVPSSSPLFAESILGGDGLDSNPPVPLLAPEVGGGMSRQAVGNYGNTPWTNVQYVITEPGTYTLESLERPTRAITPSTVIWAWATCNSCSLPSMWEMPSWRRQARR